ncbi:hypothetical protein B1R32_11340 [Abditibacterium utsteinense]|uniref:Uncharacterized protein n=1 Tax=Abditibacterium utsteinense TaxID=1960156 RepID=A0A2S8SR85_9BACT|nr:hypothetical protein [Abditibacterium utsteinense]PQV63313.1 hypothetical protein B1R32_11340 [Abditibacterium utsteinense]
MAGGLLVMSPQAHADWVLVKIKGSFDVLGQSQLNGGTLNGSPQTHPQEAIPSTYEGRMLLHDEASASIPQRPYSPYGGTSSMVSGGQAYASVQGNSFKAILEWQGGGTPTGKCYLKFRKPLGQRRFLRSKK